MPCSWDHWKNEALMIAMFVFVCTIYGNVVHAQQGEIGVVKELAHKSLGVVSHLLGYGV